MPNDLSGVEKREFASLLFISSRKYPESVSFGFKIFGFNPLAAFVGMSAFSPFPQYFEHFIVQP
jgi:hypothetical protein